MSCSAAVDPRHPYDLRRTVSLVTGASRGIGRGIALQLAKAGSRVYITGRHPQSIEATGREVGAAAAAAARGGSCVAVVCDHADDDAVRALFARIGADPAVLGAAAAAAAADGSRSRGGGGGLAVLVNSAYAGVSSLHRWARRPFWQKPLSVWDDNAGVGLRSAYVASALAAPLMVGAQRGGGDGGDGGGGGGGGGRGGRGGRGLIVNISSAGGLAYAGFVGDVAYGVAKCALDRLSADAARELRPHGVACLSLWPGMVRTELNEAQAAGSGAEGAGGAGSAAMREALAGASAESAEYAGICVAALAARPETAMAWTGMVVTTAEVAAAIGAGGGADVDGVVPRSLDVGALRAAMEKPPRHWTFGSLGAAPQEHEQGQEQQQHQSRL